MNKLNIKRLYVILIIYTNILWTTLQKQFYASGERKNVNTGGITMRRKRNTGDDTGNRTGSVSGNTLRSGISDGMP